MRLIDAELLEEQLGISDADILAKEEIRFAPTVDAVVVTRCKDCRSYNKPKTGWCEVHLDREHPDDYCSYGERKDGGADMGGNYAKGRYIAPAHLCEE